MGSVIYAFSSAILTYLTIRILGENEGGVFAIAVTLAQMFVYVAYYEMRNYQITDAQHKYSFEEYHFTKIINCILMVLISLIYILGKKYDFEKSLIVFMTCIYRMLDGYADVYESEFHACGRLDLAGKSMAFRTVASVCTYFGVLILTDNLVLALLFAIISGILGVIVFDCIVFRRTFKKKKSRYEFSKTKEIWKVCFPLFAGMFLWTYILSASRIAVDNVMTQEYQSYYQILFLPTSVINLFAGFLIRPGLAAMTEYYAKKEMGAFWKYVFKILIIIVLFTGICMGMAYVCGIPVLEMIANCDLSEYRGLFVFLIFSGAINAVACMLYFVLTIFRKKKEIMIGYGVAALFAWYISTPLTQKWGLQGAALSFLGASAILMCIFVLIILLEYSNLKKKY